METNYPRLGDLGQIPVGQAFHSLIKCFKPIECRMVVPLILCDEYYDVTLPDTYSVQAPFGSVTDWLSRHKVEIFFHEKVVRIPLPHSEMLRVLGEWPEAKVRHLMGAKAKEQKLKDIVIVRN
ncbi:hypothetical protein Tco_1459667, partial [Tanacetum coccineum]